MTSSVGVSSRLPIFQRESGGPIKKAVDKVLAQASLLKPAAADTLRYGFGGSYEYADFRCDEQNIHSLSTYHRKERLSRASYKTPEGSFCLSVERQRSTGLRHALSAALAMVGCGGALATSFLPRALEPIAKPFAWMWLEARELDEEGPATLTYSRQLTGQAEEHETYLFSKSGSVWPKAPDSIAKKGV